MAFKDHFYSILGLNDINSPKNGLLLFKPIEKAYDHYHITFIYEKDEENRFNYVLKVLDPSYKNKKLVDDLDNEQKTSLGGKQNAVKSVDELWKFRDAVKEKCKNKLKGYGPSQLKVFRSKEDVLGRNGMVNDSKMMIVDDSVSGHDTKDTALYVVVPDKPITTLVLNPVLVALLELPSVFFFVKLLQATPLYRLILREISVLITIIM